jgi:hypothetical protein
MFRATRQRSSNINFPIEFMLTEHVENHDLLEYGSYASPTRIVGAAPAMETEIQPRMEHR